MKKKEFTVTIGDLFRCSRKFPLVTFTVAALCIIVTLSAIFEPRLFDIFSCWLHPQYIWQYVSGAFLHGGEGYGTAFCLAHLCANLLMFVPYSIIIENLLGRKRTGIIFLIAWLGFSLSVHFIALAVSGGEPAQGAGLSGISYCFTTIGCYILFKLMRADRKLFRKQPLAFIFLFGLLGELLMLNPFIAGVGSLLIHISGILIGLLCILLFRTPIAEKLYSLPAPSTIPSAP